MSRREIIMLAVIIILILAGCLYFGNNYLKNERQKFYTTGVNYGQYLLMQEQTKTGNVYYLNNPDGNWSIASKSITEICSGK